MNHWKLLVQIVCALALVACAPKVRTYEKTVTSSVPTNSNSALSQAANRLGDPKDGRSGVKLINDGEQALVSRLLLAAAAERSIDAQYYLLHNDPTGHLFAASLLQAADRGVRIRLLLDDMDTSSYDAMTAALDYHKNIEIRLFNPFWRDQSLLVAGLTDFKRIKPQDAQQVDDCRQCIHHRGWAKHRCRVFPGPGRNELC